MTKIEYVIWKTGVFRLKKWQKRAIFLAFELSQEISRKKLCFHRQKTDNYLILVPKFLLMAGRILASSPIVRSLPAPDVCWDIETFINFV